MKAQQLVNYSRQEIEFMLEQSIDSFVEALDAWYQKREEALPNEEFFGADIEAYDAALDDHYYDWEYLPEKVVDKLESLGWSASSLMC